MGLKTIPVTVLDVVKFHAKLRAIRFVPEQGRAFQYQPGDYLYVRVPTREEKSVSAIRSLNNKSQVRAYSLSSSPLQDFYEITVVEKDRHPHVSRLLQQINGCGQQLEVSHPSWVRSGHLSLSGQPSREVPMVFIGGGTGIAPLVSMTRYIAASGLDTTVWLLGSFRSVDQLIFHEELVALAENHSNIHYRPTLTREAPSHWPWERGRLVERQADGTIGKNRLGELVASMSQEPNVFLCGSKALVQDCKQALLGSGVGKERIKWESWG